MSFVFFFFQAEDGIRDVAVTGVQTCALPISSIIVDQRIQVSSFSRSNQLDAGEFGSAPNRVPIRMSTIAAVISDPAHPGELWGGRGNILRRVTTHNDAFRRCVTFVEPRELRFKTSDDA